MVEQDYPDQCCPKCGVEALSARPRLSPWPARWDCPGCHCLLKLSASRYFMVFTIGGLFIVVLSSGASLILGPTLGGITFMLGFLAFFFIGSWFDKVEADE
jgi:hypothetical protein